MHNTPTLTITIDKHSMTITLPDKDHVKLITGRLATMICCNSDDVSNADKATTQAFIDAVVNDIADSP